MMRRIMRYSPGIRQKVLLVLLCVLVISLGTSAWLNIKLHESNVIHETTRHGEDLVRIVSEALTYSVVGYDYHTIKLLLEEIAKSKDVVYVKVLSGKGNIMAEAGNVIAESKSRTRFTHDILFENKVVGNLIVAIDNQGIVDQLQAQKSTVITREAIIILLIAIGEFIALSYIIVRPVTVISRALNEGIDESGQITQPIQLTGNDEFGQLAKQFNSMRLRLNDANARMQSKIDLADERLTQSNVLLLQQADELQQANKKLHKLAITDPLTGLHNRRYFDEIIATDVAIAKRHGEQDSILMIDVDHFKIVNDIHGHGVGDKVLVQLADVLSATSRKTDLLCRIGGEEFVLLCRHAGKNQAIVVAEKLRQSVEAHVFVATTGVDLNVTVSIGVALLQDDVNAVDTYVHHADLALYQSKAQGRNRVTHFENIEPESEEKLS